MKPLCVEIQTSLRHALAAVLLLPTLSWAHGAVDIPVARVLHCRIAFDYHGDPSNVKDLGCRAALVAGGAADGVWPMQQWNEVAHEIPKPGYEDDHIVRQHIPDGLLCAGGDPRKRGLDVASPHWYRTEVHPKNGHMTVRIIGTQPHVPSYAKVYITKPTYTGAAPLTWNDLEPVPIYDNSHSPWQTARKDWGPEGVPAIPGIPGFFQFEVPLHGRTGNALLYTRWQRIDPAGEGFYNCSDITIKGAGEPTFPWHDKGVFIDPAMKPHVGDTVRFRIFGHTRSYSEIVDEHLNITSANLQPNVWGQALVSRLSSHSSLVQVGVRSGSSITFDPQNAQNNRVYLADERNGFAMSVAGGGTEPPPHPGINPTPPTAVITGPTEVQSGAHFSMSGEHSVVHNPGGVRYVWWGAGVDPLNPSHVTSDFIAPTVTTQTPVHVRFQVLDDINRTENTTQKTVMVKPSGGGGEHPLYVPGHAYQGGEIVTNHGNNYQCKPFPESGWCGQSPPHYEPGRGSHWRDAWIQVH